MRNNLLIGAMLVAATPAIAYNVMTTPTAKSAVIEEFTGLACGNCPDGHRRASNLLHSHPGEVFTVCVHAGPFATSRRAGTNFITTMGREIHDYFGVNSYPCGDVNRRQFSTGLVIGRGDWNAACREVSSETSPVNLWTSASFDQATRVMTVNVEAYFTSSMTDPRLTVMLLQDNILGPQSGGELGDEYPHRHMLRDGLTENAFGDPMGVNGEGQYFTKTFTYTVPADINEVTVVPADLEILAFVSEGEHGEIVKAHASHPTGTAPATANRVFQTAPLIPVGATYAFDYLELFLDNYSDQPVTEAEIEVTLNKEKRTLTWTGNAPAHSFTCVRFESDGWLNTMTDAETSSLAYRLVSANGQAVPDQASIRVSPKAISEWPDTFTAKIKVDNDASDNVFRIIDLDGNTVKEFGPYPDGQLETYETEVKLEPGKVYGFEVSDSWGDGMYHPRGSIKFYGPDNKLVYQMMEVTDFGQRSFFRTYDYAGVDGVAVDNAVVNTEWYDLCGRRIAGDNATGLCIKVETLSDGSRVVTKTTKK